MSSNKVTIVLVGETGVGKSTLIQFFTDKNTGETDSIESGTKDPAIYQCNVDKNRDWMDTQGTSDSECKESDYDIMIKTLKTLKKNKSKNIKILWMVPNVVRQKAELQKQAKYINSLVPGKIWDSVLIITRGGRTIDDCKAAIGAAIKSGLSKSDKFKWNFNAFGYTLLEKLKNTDPMKDTMMNLDFSTRLQLGFLKNSEVKQKVLKMLSNISSCKVPIRDNEKCIKCGQKGDSRLFDTNCHSEKEEFHTGSRIHTGSYQSHHTGDWRTEHHSRVERYHPGNQRNAARTTGRVFAGIFSLGISESKNWHWWSCCKAKVGTPGCEIKEHCCDSSCRSSYSCCGGSSSSHGCEGHWTCCKRRANDGECRVFSCCKTNKFCKRRCIRCRGEWGQMPNSNCVKGNDNKHHQIINE